MTPGTRSRTDLVPAAVLAAGFLTAVGVLALLDRLPMAGFWIVLGASAAGFTAYGVDKSAARGGRRRIPEARLHLLDLLGGWPGSLLARHVFRHKTVKQPFRTIFWLTVVVNVAAVGLTVILLDGH